MIRSKLLASSLILSVLVLGVACKDDNDSRPASPPPQDGGGDKGGEGAGGAGSGSGAGAAKSISTEREEISSLVGNNKRIGYVNLSLTTTIKDQNSGELKTETQTFDTAKSPTAQPQGCYFSKHDDNSYGLVINLQNRKDVNSQEDINIQIPMNGYSQKAIPTKASYTLWDLKWVDEIVSKSEIIDSTSSSAVRVYQIGDKKLAVVTDINLRLTNDKGEEMILTGNLRCASSVWDASKLSRDLKENEAVKSIDLRSEIQAVKDAKAKAEQEVAEQEKQKELDQEYAESLENIAALSYQEAGYQHGMRVREAFVSPKFLFCKLNGDKVEMTIKELAFSGRPSADLKLSFPVTDKLLPVDGSLVVERAFVKVFEANYRQVSVEDPTLQSVSLQNITSDRGINTPVYSINVMLKNEKKEDIKISGSVKCSL
jgi:hypothetical protein